MPKNVAVVRSVPAPQLNNVDILADLQSGPTGLDHVSQNDILIPRLVILQSLSPQLTKSKPEYIPDAKPGMFCDTATGDLFETLTVLPCAYLRLFLEWAPRGSGGSRVPKSHGISDAIMRQTRIESGRPTLPNGNYIAETAVYYVLNLSSQARPSFIPLASTNLKSARKWMTAITSQRIERDGVEFMPPLWFRSWRAETSEQSNDKGTWFGWKFAPGPSVLEDDKLARLLPSAKKFAQDVFDGMVVADYSESEEAVPDERI